MARYLGQKHYKPEYSANATEIHIPGTNSQLPSGPARPGPQTGPALGSAPAPPSAPPQPRPRPRPSLWLAPPPAPPPARAAPWAGSGSAASRDGAKMAAPWRGRWGRCASLPGGAAGPVLAPLPAPSCSHRLTSRTPAPRACSCRGRWRRSWRRRRRSGPRTGSCGPPARWHLVSRPGPARPARGTAVEGPGPPHVSPPPAVPGGAGEPLGTLGRRESSLSSTGRSNTRGKPPNTRFIKFWYRCGTGGTWFWEPLRFWEN